MCSCTINDSHIDDVEKPNTLDSWMLTEESVVLRSNAQKYQATGGHGQSQTSPHFGSVGRF